MTENISRENIRQCFVFSVAVRNCSRFSYLLGFVDIFASNQQLTFLTQPVATLPCNVSLVTCFLMLMFHKVVWQHVQGVVRFLVTTMLQIYREIFQRKQFENQLRFDIIMAMSLWLPSVFWHTLYVCFCVCLLGTPVSRFGDRNMRTCVRKGVRTPGKGALLRDVDPDERNSL